MSRQINRAYALFAAIHFITTAHIFNKNKVLFHATSFTCIVDGKIVSIEEYWGNDGAAFQWRLEEQIKQ